MPRKGTTRTYRCPDTHKHGCVTCYKHGCGCGPCVEANTNTAKEWRKRHAYGRTPDRRDPAAAIAHLRRLKKAGWTWRMIVDVTGLNKAHLQRIVNHPPAWVSPDTETRILAAHIRPPRHADAFVPAVGTARRLRALVHSGYTMTDLGERLGISVQQVWLMCVRQELVTERTRQKVADVFAEIWATPGPSAHARRVAARHGWVSALAWDDIDSKTERPKGRIAA